MSAVATPEFIPDTSPDFIPDAPAPIAAKRSTPDFIPDAPDFIHDAPPTPQSIQSSAAPDPSIPFTTGGTPEPDRYASSGSSQPLNAPAVPSIAEAGRQAGTAFVNKVQSVGSDVANAGRVVGAQFEREGATMGERYVDRQQSDPDVARFQNAIGGEYSEPAMAISPAEKESELKASQQHRDATVTREAAAQAKIQNPIIAAAAPHVGPIGTILASGPAAPIVAFQTGSDSVYDATERAMRDRNGGVSTQGARAKANLAGYAGGAVDAATMAVAPDARVGSRLVQQGIAFTAQDAAHQAIESKATTGNVSVDSARARNAGLTGVVMDAGFQGGEKLIHAATGGEHPAVAERRSAETRTPPADLESLSPPPPAGKPSPSAAAVEATPAQPQRQDVNDIPTSANPAGGSRLAEHLAAQPRGAEQAMRDNVDSAVRNGQFAFFVDPAGMNPAEKLKLDAYRELAASMGHDIGPETFNSSAGTITASITPRTESLDAPYSHQTPQTEIAPPVIDASGNKPAPVDAPQLPAFNKPVDSAAGNESRRPLWEMRPRELDEHLEHASGDAARAEVEVFGEEGARRWRMLQRKANSSNTVAADSASKEIGEMDARLTPEQSARLYGYGQDVLDPQEVKQYRTALESLDFDNEAALGRSLGHAITNVGDKSDPMEMNPAERRAFAQIRFAGEEMRRRGLNEAQVMEAAVRASASRFSDPNDAEFMLRRFLGPRDSTVQDATKPAPENRQLADAPAANTPPTPIERPPIPEKPPQPTEPPPRTEAEQRDAALAFEPPDNSPKPSGPLFSENSAEKATRILDPRSQLGVNEQVWANNDRDLAAGQGDNRGVVIEFDHEKVKATAMTNKPSAEFAAAQGKHEFSLHGQSSELSSAVKSVTVDPNLATGPFASRLGWIMKRQGFEPTANEDGTITYRPKATEETAIAAGKPAQNITDSITAPADTIEPLAPDKGAGRTTPPNEAPQRPGGQRNVADLQGKEPHEMSRAEWKSHSQTVIGARQEQQLLRVKNARDENRLPALAKRYPSQPFPKVESGESVNIYRGVSAGQPLRPGDWVALRPEYAKQHTEGRGKGAKVIKAAVSSDDIVWAGTDANEYFYAPRHSVKASDAHEFAVRRAISEGKTVAPEVLADYPDLAKSFNQPAPAASGGKAAPEKLPPVTDAEPPARTGERPPIDPDEKLVSREEMAALNAPMDESPAEPTKPAAGASPAAEGPPERMTSARKAMTAQDREALGLAGLNSPERRGWQEAFDQAESKGIPDRAMDLVHEVNQNGRAFSDVETAGIVKHAAKLKNDYGSRMEEIGKLVDEGADRGEIALRSAEAERIRQDFDLASDALKTSGTEKGRALAAQKLTINQDYKLISVLNRAKAARGEELKPSSRATYEQLTKQMEEHTARIADLESKLADRSSRDVLNQSRAKKYSKMTPEQKAAELQQNYGKLRELLQGGCNN